MWHWRWTQIFSYSLILLMALPIHASMGAEPPLSSTSSGPAYTAEGQILWHDAQEDYKAGRYQDSSEKLKRFVARYPGYPGSIESRLLLGRALLRQGQPDQAKAPLQEYIQLSGNKSEAIRARVDLGNVLLQLHQYPEAQLMAEEILKFPAQKVPEVPSEALVIKAKSLIALNHDSRAQDAALSAAKRLPSHAEKALQGEVQLTLLELKSRHCAELPGKGPLDEAQIRNQLERRGTCLLESLNVYRKALAIADVPTAESAHAVVYNSYVRYMHDCKHPPTPPPTHPKDRTPEQLKSYFREIAEVLKQDCSEKIHEGHDLMVGWDTGISREVMPHLINTIQGLERLASFPIGESSP